MHICYGYGIKANIDWKNALGAEWRQYEKIFPALAQSRIDQVSLECIHSHVPLELLALLDGKDVLAGVIDVASDTVETPEEVAGVIDAVMQVRAQGAHRRLHQLRHGADAARRGRGQSSGRSAPAPRWRANVWGDRPSPPGVIRGRTAKPAAMRSSLIV